MIFDITISILLASRRVASGPSDLVNCRDAGAGPPEALMSGPRSLTDTDNQYPGPVDLPLARSTTDDDDDTTGDGEDGWPGSGGTTSATI